MNRRRNLDHYSKKAKAEGFAARSVFKLDEIQRRFLLINSGDRILDLGCAPGSWIKYAALKVGPSGCCVGIDRSPINLSMPNVRTYVGDIYEIDDALFEEDGKKFNLVMSDMAPDTCGNRLADHLRSVQLSDRALEIAKLYLELNGHFICKVFEGSDLNQFVEDVKGVFKKVKRVKPKSTRSESVELFIVGIGFKGTAS